MVVITCCLSKNNIDKTFAHVYSKTSFFFGGGDLSTKTICLLYSNMEIKMMSHNPRIC